MGTGIRLVNHSGKKTAQRGKKISVCLAVLLALTLLIGCSGADGGRDMLQVPILSTSGVLEENPEQSTEILPPDAVTVGVQEQNGFILDNVYHSELGDIHYSSCFPQDYDGSESYALFITLPGWGGFYIHGVGANMNEDFGPQAIQYREKLIVLSLQLEDWGETSAGQTIALTEYFLSHYNIDRNAVYLHGMSAGGETGSLVMGKRPELYTAYWMTASKWDGDLNVLAQAGTPVYLAVGENDSYYGSESLKNTYDALKHLYAEQGLSEEDIGQRLVLDVKPQSYFTERGYQDQHMGGQAFAYDETMMKWLFGTPSGKTIPPELEYIPNGYTNPAQYPGTLERLDYETWESFTYAEHSQRLTKTAWVYLPYGYSPEQKYNILYLSHGGWSDETGLMGTPEDLHPFKHIIDNAIENGKIQPLIIVLPTYNNTSPSDSGNYSLALRLTDQFHNELVNDLLPAVESRYSTYAESTDLEGLAASRDHRAFGGFSMGSVNTWHTFEYCLDYFRYFAPSSGGPVGGSAYMADIVRNSGHSPEDFFIFTASGTDDFAYAGFKQGVMAMAGQSDVFTLADSEQDGNLSFREREGYTHNGIAANEYIYNALRFFWN